MPNTCVVSGCGAAFFEFPNDGQRRRKWMDFVKETRPDWCGNADDNFICCKHFDDNQYKIISKRELDLFNKLLKTTAVPSIHTEVDNLPIHDDSRLPDTEDHESAVSQGNSENCRSTKEVSTQCCHLDFGLQLTSHTEPRTSTRLKNKRCSRRLAVNQKPLRKLAMKRELLQDDEMSPKKIKILIEQDAGYFDGETDNQVYIDECENITSSDIPLSEISTVSIAIDDTSTNPNESTYSGDEWFPTYADAKEATNRFQSNTGIKLAKWQVQTYGLAKARMHWNNTTPYIILKKERYKSAVSLPPSDLNLDRRIDLLRVLIFPDYKVELTRNLKDLNKNRSVASSTIKHALNNDDGDLTKEEAFCVKFPVREFNRAMNGMVTDLESKMNSLGNSSHNMCSLKGKGIRGRSLVNDHNTQTVYTLEGAHKAIEQFEIATSTKYIVKGRHTCDISKCRVFFDDNTLTPYIILKNKLFGCHHGRDYNKSYNDRCRRRLSNRPSRMQWCVPVSKKTDCKASISVLEMLHFPQFKLSERNPDLISRARYTIRKGLDDNDEKLIKKFVCRIQFPNSDEHSGHALGEEAGRLQPVDKRLIAKVQDLVDQGIKSPPDMKDKLEHYVLEELFKDRDPPPRSSRRFFPTIKDVRNCRYRAVRRRKEEADLQSTA